MLLAEATIEPEVLDRWPERTVLFGLRAGQLVDAAWSALDEPALDEAASWMIRLVENPELRRRMGARAARDFEERQKRMIAGHFERLEHAREEGRKVVYTFVPGNLTEIIGSLGMLPVPSTLATHL